MRPGGVGGRPEDSGPDGSEGAGRVIGDSVMAALPEGPGRRRYGGVQEDSDHVICERHAFTGFAGGALWMKSE